MTYKKIELLTTEQVTPLYLFQPPKGYTLVPNQKLDQFLDLVQKLGEVNRRSLAVKAFCERTLGFKSTTEEERESLQEVLDLLQGVKHE